MRNQKDSTSTVIHFSPTRALKSDPLSAEVMTHYSHQMDLLSDVFEAFNALIQGIRNWNSRQALSTDLNAMPDYILKDIGIRRDQIPAVISGKLRRGSLGLSPTGNQSAPAFYKEKDTEKENDGTPLAA